MMRQAACRCGELKIRCEGDPVRVSVCHCLECQRRTGSAFGVQARFATADVTIEGDFSIYERTSDRGRWARYRFCPKCGSTVAYENEDASGLIAVPVGAFADPNFPLPQSSGYERRRHRWVSIVGGHIDHLQS
jgi:hypothetical protein